MGYSVKPLTSSFKTTLTLRGKSDILLALHSGRNLKSPHLRAMHNAYSIGQQNVAFNDTLKTLRVIFRCGDYKYEIIIIINNTWKNALLKRYIKKYLE